MWKRSFRQEGQSNRDPKFCCNVEGQEGAGVELGGWSWGKTHMSHGFADHGKDLGFGEGDHCRVLRREET